MIGQDQFERSAALAMRARSWLRRLTGSAGSFGGLKAIDAPRLAEFGLAALIALLCAGIALDMVAPLPVSRKPAVPSAARADRGIEARNPFFSPARETAQTAAAPAAETTLDLKLHGTWIDDAGGTAIIRTPDGKQKTYAVGDAVCCGARLDGVFADRVVILRDGVRESLRLPRDMDASARAAAPTTAPPPAKRNAEDLRRIIRVQPVSSVGGARFALFPAGDVAAFEALGLREGDILLRINGAPAPQDAEGFARLVNTLADAGEATLTVERDGATATVRIAPAAGG
ncbi:type II secretion system protein N [Amphiplicatus metriothermophilus]|nr:type II secretion system protein N [Amphiplicatus metriothermophilus]